MWAPSRAERVLLLIVLTQATLSLVLLAYLAASGKRLLVAVAARDEGSGPAGALTIPVAGVRPDELRDTFGAPRSGGRTHEGIDIFAPEGTPVLAAADGVIVGRDSSALGGVSLYHRDLDGRTIYFYGHLQRYRGDLKEGDLVRAGDVIAYVGQTGNVPPGHPHLHFSIHVVDDPNRWWRGRVLDPCDLLPCEAAPDVGGS